MKEVEGSQQEVLPLSLEKIEESVSKILDDYSAAFKWQLAPPVPVEMITERFFDLHCIVVPLAQYGRTDIEGALDPVKRKLIINTRIRASGRRWNFVIAHEIGHWVLHFKQPWGMETGHFTDLMEEQADTFARVLLLPSRFLDADLSHLQSLRRSQLRELARRYEVTQEMIIDRLRGLPDWQVASRSAHRRPK